MTPAQERWTGVMIRLLGAVGIAGAAGVADRSLAVATIMLIAGSGLVWVGGIVCETAQLAVEREAVR